jgi:hypothetical protein
MFILTNFYFLPYDFLAVYQRIASVIFVLLLLFDQYSNGSLRTK